MSWLRGLWGSLRLLLGARIAVPSDDTIQPLLTCTHPYYALTACTYQLGPKGKYAWLCRCTRCGAWFAC